MTSPAGIKVELKMRSVTIISLCASASLREEENLAQSREDAEKIDQIHPLATVSKGTTFALSRATSRCAGPGGTRHHVRRHEGRSFTSVRRYRWTNWPILLRARTDEDGSPVAAGWTTSRPSVTPTRPACSDMDRRCSGSPRHRGFTWRWRRKRRSPWSRFRMMAARSCAGSTSRLKEYDDVDYRREKGRSDQGQCPRRQ